MYRTYIKRFLDIIVASVAFLALSPLFVVVFVFLLIYYKGNPFFFQKRPGYKSKIFSVIKFKSMIDKFDQDGIPLPDRERITKVGTFIRKTSLDELPQLINVIKGDMSFIGPRPLLVRYLPYYTQRELKRHDVRPGITGLAQVSGRNYLEWQDRLELDAQYVERLSAQLDFEIFLKTVVKVFKGSDIKVVPTGKDLDVYRKAEHQFNS
jgi:undecaprenyl phosphate N,N'-diacetylbacillosamine 1-phosphate transferase